MEHAPPPTDDYPHDAARTPGGVVHGVRLNVGQPPSGLVPLATLGLAAAAVGWGATTMLVALVNARSLNGSAVGLSVAALVVAIVLRLLFMQTWRARRVNRRLRFDTRKRLDAVLAGGVAPDILTLCWCIAVASGCSNRDPRPLTLALLEDIEARLGVRLPRNWYFDGRGPMAGPGGTRTIPNGGYRVTRPCRPHRIATDILTLLIILGVVPLSLAMSLAAAGQGAATPGPHPGVVLTLMAVAVTMVMLLRAWAARREWHVECSLGDRLVLRFEREANHGVQIRPDCFLISFTPIDEGHRSFRLQPANIPPDRRLRLLGHAPWRSVEVSLTRHRPSMLGLER